MIVLSLILILFVLLLLYVYSPFKRPFLTESDWTYHKAPWWQLYYSSKYLSPVKKPFRGSGLEEAFSKDMSPDQGGAVMLNPQPVVIKAVGDLMCRKDLAGEGGKELWSHIGSDVFCGDLRIANMEFAVNPKCIIEELLRFSVPESYAEPLLGDSRFGMFDVVSLANNHINDSLSGGIISTCDFLDRREVAYSGACRTSDEQDLFPIFECRGIKIAVLSYTFSTNGIPLESSFKHGTNLVRFNALVDDDYDPSMIYRQIKLARSRGADFIVACNHWGVEFEYYPPHRLVNRAHNLLDSGIDLIIGHHPHIINLSERYRTKDGRDTAVLYSLGNLTSWGLKFAIQKMSHIAEVTLDTGFDSSGRKMVRLGNIRLTPVIHTMVRQNGKVVHKLLPVIKTVENLKSGKYKEKLTWNEKRLLRKVEKEHRKYFRQKGFEYT
ncbi:MAG: CapA family protein [Fibrobacter sp.]|nr:CapA family protein [Fibrobacter sp.]